MILGTLQEKFWELAEKIDLDKLDGNDAFGHLNDILDKNFKYDPDVELPSRHEQYFTRLCRLKGETLQNYICRRESADAQLKEVGADLPDKTRGWHLLARSAIPEDKIPIVKSMTRGTMEVDKLKDALLEMFGADSLADARDISAVRKRLSGSSVEEAHYVDGDDYDYDFDYDYYDDYEYAYVTDELGADWSQDCNGA